MTERHEHGYTVSCNEDRCPNDVTIWNAVDEALQWEYNLGWIRFPCCDINYCPGCQSIDVHSRCPDCGKDEDGDLE